MGRCKHLKWKVVSRRFTPPLDGKMTFTRATPQLVQDVTFGFTMIEQQCEACGRTEFTKVRGDQTNA